QAEGKKTFTHDCTTLGGNSGSIVLDVETGAALGLHYAGQFHRANFAVTADVLRERLRKLKVVFAAPKPAGEAAPGIEIPRRKPEEYADRKGYQEDFLGTRQTQAVPLPDPGANDGH